MEIVMARKATAEELQEIERAAYSMIDNHGRHAAEVASRRLATW